MRCVESEAAAGLGYRCQVRSVSAGSDCAAEFRSNHRSARTCVCVQWELLSYFLHLGGWESDSVAISGHQNTDHFVS